jgi:hypothetical protein
LTAIGDAIREYKPTKSNVIGEEVLCKSIDYNLNGKQRPYSLECKLIIPNAKSVKLLICAYHPSIRELGIYKADDITFSTPIDNKLQYGTKTSTSIKYDEYFIEDTNGIFLYGYSGSYANNAYYSLRLYGYDENGNEIMTDKIEEVENTMTPAEMVNAINDLPVIPEDKLIITGNCESMFSHNQWNWLIEKYGDKIITKDITNINSMFQYNRQIKEIPFDINCAY